MEDWRTLELSHLNDGGSDAPMSASQCKSRELVDMILKRRVYSGLYSPEYLNTTFRMARPRKFEREEVLDQGMRLLWAQGYEITSLEDLLAAMKLSKSSFYEAFTSKHDFLMAALTRYIDTVLGQLERDLQEGSAREAISRSFQSMLPTRGASPNGCFVQNCAIELAHRDPEARMKVADGLRRLEQGYHRVVLRGQQRGEIEHKQNARMLARFLVSSLNGIQVFARAGAERKELHQIAEFTLGLIK